MGRRSRKRADPERPATTRAERDALRDQAPPRTDRKGRELPPAPWGSFPLTELIVLLALIFGIWGFVTFGSDRGKVMVLAAMALGSLGGLEISVREHFAGYRSHSTLLAGAAGVATMMALAFAFAVVFGGTVAGYTGATVIGIAVGLVAFRAFRQSFRRRTGGLSFR